MRRSATWLELFFDLGYVALIAQLTYNISPSEDMWMLAKYFLVFLMVFHLWFITTINRNLHEKEEKAVIIFTQIQLFFLMLISVFLAQIDTGGIYFILTGILGARATILYMIYHFRKRGNKKVREGRKNYFYGYLIGTLAYACLIFVPNPLIYIFLALLIVYDYLLPNMKERGHEGPGLLKIDKHHLYERFGLFKILVIGESILVVALVSEGTENLISLESMFFALFGFATLCLMWWAYFPMLEDQMSKKESKSINRFLLSHIAMFIGVILFAVGIKGALELSNHQYNEHFFWFLSAGIMTYILGNTSLRILHIDSQSNNLAILGSASLLGICVCYFYGGYLYENIFVILGGVFGIMCVFTYLSQKFTIALKK